MKTGLKKSVLFVFLIIFTFVCASGEAMAAKKKKVNHAQLAFEAGMTAYQNEDYQNAIYAFQNSIGYNKKMYKSYYMLGFSLFMNNEPQAAEESLINTIEKFPHEWKAQALLAEYYAGQKNYELATVYYQKTINAKNILPYERESYEEKLAALQKERADQWRVPEEEKDRLIKRFKMQLDMKKWRAATIEKKGTDIHIAYVLKDEDVVDNAWSNMVDIVCITPKLGGFAELNQNTADQYRKQGATMDTIDQTGESRVYETRIPGKQPVYIIGRIFKSNAGYCTVQVMRKKKRFKDFEQSEWIDKIKLITVEPEQMNTF